MLHTSDWHLGRSFGNHSLLNDQAEFLDWLVGLVGEESIDLVVIAGDLFDRSVPPADAVALFHQTMTRLLDAGADVAAIAGNHDSADRIGSIEGLLTDGLLLRGGYNRAADVTVRSYDDGPLAIVAVPYLDPVFARVSSVDGADGDGESAMKAHKPTHESVLRDHLERARQSMAPDMRSVVIAHAFVATAVESDSERTIAVGDSGLVAASHFAPFNYAALGHLHRPQIVSGDETIRYSGSPLPYSFSESHQKEIVIVEIDDDGDTRCKPVAIEAGRGIATVRGSIDELVTGAATTDNWTRIELTDAHPVADAHLRLRRMFPNLVEIIRTPAAVASADSAVLTSHAVRTRTRTELAAGFLREVADLNDPADAQLVVEAIQQAELAALREVS